MRIDREVPAFTAKCHIVREGAAYRLTFLCDICDGGYTTPPLICDTPEEARRLAEQEARLHFNRCGCCLRWVCDEHFNENRMMCTSCMPRTCARCGSPVSGGADLCANCGAPQFEAERGEGE